MMLSSSVGLLPFLLLAAATGPSKKPILCHEIPNKTPFSEFKDCEYVNGNGIGNINEFVQLDLSDASEHEITTFFAKPTEEEVTLSAGIRLVDNNNIETLDFGKVRDILFNDKATEKLSHECVFIYNNNSGDTTPSDQKLAVCKAMGGDLYLEDRKLPSSLEVAMGCLRLINVDFGEFHIKPRLTGKRKPRYQCSGGSRSAFIRNKNLCGPKMRLLVDYIQGADTLVESDIVLGIKTKDIQLDLSLHEQTCSRDCTRQEVADAYYLCSTIKEDADIAEWFRYKGFAQKRGFLQSSTATLTIANSRPSNLSLPNLKSVTYLVIWMNHNLTSFDMPSLEKVDRLNVSFNPKWTLTEFSKTFEKIDEVGPESYVECLIDTPVITNFRQIKLCTHLKGDLTLRGVSNEDDKLFTATILDGCLTVKNTALTSLRFLEGAIIGSCTGQHLIEDNPQLCARGYLTGVGNVVRRNNADKGCPCTLDDLAKSAASRPSDCSVTHANKEFDCNLYDGSQLVEVKGTLTVVNCHDLDADFPALKKITSEVVGAVALTVTNSSALPSLEFLKRIDMGFSTLDTHVAIDAKMTIHEYLLYEYTFGPHVWQSEPDKAYETCYDIWDFRYDCTTFEGDLVVNKDALDDHTSLETITGCLIVQNGTQLFFLDRIKHIGNTCLYQDEKKYPLSPSRGFKKTTISQMKKKYCPPREERERLAPITNLTTIELSGEAPECSKSCNKMSAGNCDTFYGNLVLSPNDYVKNLEVIYGSLVIEGMLPETMEFPKLTRIENPTAPALAVNNNRHLRSLLMPKLVNISADDNGRPLIMVTRNPNLQNLSDFIPSALLPSCENVRNALCYADILGQDEVVEKKDRNWEDAKILAVVLALMFGVPVAYHFLTFEEREAALEERERRREEARRRRKTDRRRRDRGEARSPRTAKAPTPAQTSRIAKSLMTTAPGGSSSSGKKSREGTESASTSKTFKTRMSPEDAV